VIVVPPLDAGAVQATVTDVGLAMVAVPIVGAPDTVTTGVTETAVDELDVPAEFVAVVVNVKAVPFVKPVTTHEPDAPVTVQVRVTPETCGDALTV
jgi:hypothetical protein